MTSMRWRSWAAYVASSASPVNLGANINSAFGETRASLSRDGKRLYFGSNRPGFEGNFDIFVSVRR
jgi:hypothetical protein